MNRTAAARMSPAGVPYLEDQLRDVKQLSQKRDSKQTRRSNGTAIFQIFSRGRQPPGVESVFIRSQTVPARRRAAAREKVRDARAQDAENTKATDPVLRAAEREHSSGLQPGRNALLEDMTRLFLIPQRYAASRTADPVLGHD